jgi:SseB protein N-terminal domain
MNMCASTLLRARGADMPSTLWGAIIAPMTEQPQAGPWGPSNDVERQLLDALSRDDRQAFFTVLSEAPLYLPLAISDPEVTAAGGGEANPDDYLTFVSGEVTYLLVFTSVETLQGLVGDVANGYVETNFEVLRANLTGTELRLGFNPGTPVDAWLDVESLVRAANGEILVPTGLEMAELMQLSDTDDEEFDAEADRELENYVVDYVDKLVEGDVMVVTDGDFWRIAPVDGVPTVEVYSTEESVPPDTRTVTVPFLHLIAKWPAAAEQLSVNPGTPLSFTLPATMLNTFAQQLRPN